MGKICRCHSSTKQRKDKLGTVRERGVKLERDLEMSENDIDET